MFGMSKYIHLHCVITPIAWAIVRCEHAVLSTDVFEVRAHAFLDQLYAALPNPTAQPDNRDSLELIFWIWSYHC